MSGAGYVRYDQAEQAWFAYFQGQRSAPFNSHGAALAWLRGCEKTGKYRS